LHDLATRSTEGQADADLAAPAYGLIGQDAVKTDLASSAAKTPKKPDSAARRRSRSGLEII